MAKRRRTINIWLVVLLFVIFYTGLSVYSGTFLPLRLVTDASMEPALHAGDIVLLRSVPFSKIETGDLIAYTSAGTHPSGKSHTIFRRVVGFEVNDGSRVVRTRGDAIESDISMVAPEAVRWKPVLRIPFLGRPLVFLNGVSGLIAIAVVPVILSLLVAASLMLRLAPGSIPTRIPIPGLFRKREDYVQTLANTLGMRRFRPSSSHEFDLPEHTPRKTRTASRPSNSSVRGGQRESPETAAAIPLPASVTSRSEVVGSVESLAESPLSLETRWVPVSDGEGAGGWSLGANRLWDGMDVVETSFADPNAAIQPFIAFNSLWMRQAADHESIRANAPRSLAQDQSEVRESMLQLNESIVLYTSQLRNHASAVENLASLSRVIEDAVREQEEALEHAGAGRER